MKEKNEHFDVPFVASTEKAFSFINVLFDAESKYNCGNKNLNFNQFFWGKKKKNTWKFWPDVCTWHFGREG